MPGTDHIFNIIPQTHSPWDLFNGLLMGLTGLQDLKTVYQQVSDPDKSCGDFIDAALKALGIQWQMNREEQARIPQQGPLVVVSNHPYGGAEAMILARILLQVRPDVKFLANHLLHRIPELKELVLPVDPFGQPGSASANVAAIKRSIHWVRNGGALALFPAGEVAHFKFAHRRIADPDWKESAGRLIQQTGAPVLPVYFPGCNDALFQCAGIVHPRLRTALLGHELLNKKGRMLRARAGKLIPGQELASMTSRDCIRYLRKRTDLMAAPPTPRGAAIQILKLREPLVAPASADHLKQELALMPPTQRLAQAGSISAWIADACQIPTILREIGRLREETFRLSGEGTGKGLDLDDFDRVYLQLFLWDEKQEKIVGGYRLGPTDRVHHLYTRTLFHYPKSLLAGISPALELGRSFVRQEYQRSYLPLLLLWKGIGRYLVQNPRYRHLFGAVSMSADYSQYSRVLLAAYLEKHHRYPAALSGLHNPMNGILRQESCLDLNIQSLEELSEIIRQLEPDGKEIPILFKKYLELGGQILAFQVDHKFGSTLDGLILVDLDKANRRLLEFYLGKEGSAAFLNDLSAAVR